MENMICCPYCNHAVPVLIKDDLLHIAGHHYLSSKEEAHEVREHQVDGPDLITTDYERVSVTKYCDGGSLKIIGFADEQERDAAASPVTGLPPRARITKVSVRDGKVTVFYRHDRPVWETDESPDAWAMRYSP